MAASGDEASIIIVVVMVIGASRVLLLLQKSRVQDDTCTSLQSPRCVCSIACTAEVRTRTVVGVVRKHRLQSAAVVDRVHRQAGVDEF